MLDDQNETILRLKQNLDNKVIAEKEFHYDFFSFQGS